MKNQRFGIEIEMTGLSRQRAGQVLSEYFGTRLFHDGGSYDTYSVLDSQNRGGKIYRACQGTTNGTGKSVWLEMVVMVWLIRLPLSLLLKRRLSRQPTSTHGKSSVSS